jgi:hypothetical protein
MFELVSALIGGGLAFMAWRAYLARLPEWRRAMVREAERQAEIRRPYQWGGGHVPDTWGLDCSGLVIWCAKAAGFEFHWNSNSILHLAEKVSVPEPGDLALYGPKPDHAVHVRMVVAFDASTGVASCIASEGGDQTTITPAIAAAQKAFVKPVPDHRSPRFLGFRSIASIAEGRRSGALLASAPELDASERWG